MMTEELKVKISVDTSGINTALSKVRNSFKTVGHAGGEAAGASEQMEASLEQVHNSLQQIRNLSVFELLAKGIDKASDNLVDMTGHISNAFASLRKNSKLYTHIDWEGPKEAIKSFKINIKEAGSSFVMAGKEARRTLDDIIPRGAQKAVLAIVALVAVVKTLGAAIRNALNVAQEVKNLVNEANKLNMSAKAYQEWAYILERQGVGSDKLADFMKTLADEQNAVREGSEDIIQAFAKIGISAKEAASMTQQQLFEKVVKNLQNVEDPVMRTSIAFKIFGEDASELNNVLRLSNEETAALANNLYLLGGAMSESLIQKSTALSSAVSNLKTAWQGLTYTLGELFMPIITKIVNALTKAIAIVNMFLRTVFGLELTPSSSNDPISSATGSMGGYTESVENATEAVNKLKRVTMGFDELNIVRDPNTAGAGSGADAGAGIPNYALGGSGLNGAIPDMDDLGLGKWKERFEKYKTLIQDMTTWGLIGVGIGGAVLCALTGNWPGVLACLALAGIGIGIGNIEGGTFDRLRAKFESLGLEIIPTAMTVIGATGAVIALLMGNIPAAIALAGMAGIGFALSGSSSISDFVKTYESEIAKIFNIATIAIGTLGVVMCMLTGNIPGALLFAALGGIALYNLGTGGNFFDDAINAIKSMWEGLRSWFITNIKPVFTSSYWDEKWETIRQSTATKLEETKKKIQEKWENVRVWFNQSVKPKFTISYWSGVFESVRQAAATKFEETKKKIQEKWEGIRIWFSQVVKPKFTISYWQGVFENVRKGVALKLDELRTRLGTGWSAITNWFKQNVAPKFTVSFWKAKFGTVKDGMKAAFNGVIEVAEKAVNNIISKINSLSWKIPDWVPKLGGKKFGFDFKSIKIPRLATGGIAISSTLANIGENGREAVLPLDRNTEWMDALADKIAARNNTPSKIILKVGEREMGWAAINSINQITKQTGGLQLQLV